MDIISSISAFQVRLGRCTRNMMGMDATVTWQLQFLRLGQDDSPRAAWCLFWRAHVADTGYKIPTSHGMMHDV